MHSEGDRVTDEVGVEFTLGSLIAKGGQGVVHRAAGLPNYAIKLLTRPEELAAIETVRRLPLDGLNIAPPITLIRRGGAGYVMRLVGEMTPLRTPYLPTEFGPGATASWYLTTGGLRRRLSLAARVAGTLASLHSLALAYVDLNPNNVMVSEDMTRDETWLIDTDNLTSMVQPAGNILGFPGYIAPERIVSHRPASTLADAHSLAVLAFRLLVLAHPLMGLATHAVDAVTADDLVDRGEVAYVADPTDGSNRLPRNSLSDALLPLVLSGRLQQLSLEAFGQGRLDPLCRPSAARWRDVLHSALDNVIGCGGGCGWTYYRTRATCPSCGSTTREVSLLSVYGGDYMQPGAARDSLVIDPQRETPILPRHAWGRYETAEPLVVLVPDTKGYLVRAQGEVRVTDVAGTDVSLLRRPRTGDVRRVLLTAPSMPTRLLALRSVEAR